MTIHFYLKFYTRFGQALFVSGNIDELGNDKTEAAFPLKYLSHEFWEGSVIVSNKNEIEKISYTYLLRNEDGTEVIDGETQRVINIAEVTAEEIVLSDAWNDAGN